MSVTESVLERERGTTQQYLTFQLNEQEFGLEILQVQEIKNFSRITPIPNSPPNVLGVMNLRGTIIPIVDLRRTFKMPETQYNSFTVIVVVNIGAKVVGLVVDAVSDVRDVLAGDIEFPSTLKHDSSTSVISGVAKSGEHLITLLDIAKLLPEETVV